MTDTATKQKPGIDIKPLTFKGRTWRVQLGVTDFHDGAIEGWKTKPVTFWVARLPMSAHPSTAFSKGVQIYYGADFAVAIVRAEITLGKQVWPCEFTRDWDRYAEPDSLAFRDRLERVGMRVAEGKR